MAYYLVQASYTADAIKAMVNDPQYRQTVAHAAMEAMSTAQAAAAAHTPHTG